MNRTRLKAILNWPSRLVSRDGQHTAVLFTLASLLGLAGCQTEGDRRVAYEFRKMNYDECQKHLHLDYTTAQTDTRWKALAASHNITADRSSLSDDELKDCLAITAQTD